MRDPLPVVPLWQRALRKMRLAFDTWYPWDQRKLLPKLRPLKLRLIEAEDFEWCERLYLRNERCGIPASGHELYSEYLRSRENIVFIAEESSGRVATFGMHRIDESTGYVCYLLVDPGIHQSGVGTTLMTAAISLLGISSREQEMVLTAFDTSLPFYRKLGYVPFHEEKVNGRRLTYAALAPILLPLVLDCRQMLQDAGAVIPDFSRDIPYSRQPLFPENDAA